MDLNQRFPIGTCQLIWFLDPDNLGAASGGGEIGMGSQFFPDREAALESADLYAGDWVILELMMQNPDPDNNYFWRLLEYGAWKKFKKNSFGRM